MNRYMLSILAAASLPLAGCALGGLGDVLGDRSGGYGPYGAYGQGGPDFADMAVDACGREASRYGRVGISNVQRQSSSTLRVSGTIDNGYQRRAFGCSYREDGRITDFDVR